jgi:hypothetical protein
MPKSSKKMFNIEDNLLDKYNNIIHGCSIHVLLDVLGESFSLCLQKLCATCVYNQFLESQCHFLCT